MIRECLLHWGCIKVESRKFLRSLKYTLVYSMMSLHWSCSIQWFGSWVMQSTHRPKVPMSYRSRVSLTSLCLESHSLRYSDLWSVPLGSFVPLQTWVFGRGQDLKAQKVKGHCKTKQECAIKVTAYSNSADLVFCYFWQMSHLGHFCFTYLRYILMAHFRLLCPLLGLCIVLLSFNADTKTFSVRTHCSYQSASSVMEAAGMKWLHATSCLHRISDRGYVCVYV